MQGLPTTGGLGTGNGGHSHYDQVIEASPIQWAHGYGTLSIKAASQLLDMAVQSSCTLSPRKRWDYPQCITLARPLTGNLQG